MGFPKRWPPVGKQSLPSSYRVAKLRSRQSLRSLSSGRSVPELSSGCLISPAHGVAAGLAPSPIARQRVAPEGWYDSIERNLALEALGDQAHTFNVRPVSAVPGFDCPLVDGDFGALPVADLLQL